MSDKKIILGGKRMCGETKRLIEELAKDRTVKVIERDASVIDTDGYKYFRSEYICENCKKRVIGGDNYCSGCGAKLDWSRNE